MGPIPQCVHVTLHHSQGEESLASVQGRLVYEGTARFAEQAPEPIAAPAFELARPRASKFTAEQLYERAMAVPRPAHAGPDRGRAGEPRAGSRERSPCFRSPGSCEPGEPGLPHRPHRPGHVHPPARAAGGWIAWSRATSSSRSGWANCRSTARHRQRARPSLAGSGSVRSSSIAFASMPSSSDPTAASGCGSATGKTGDSTGLRAIATCSDRPTRS